MVNTVNQNPEWVTRGKTIRQLILELQSFENQDLEVKISTDGGENYTCISLVVKQSGSGTSFCVLKNCE